MTLLDIMMLYKPMTLPEKIGQSYTHDHIRNADAVHYNDIVRNNRVDYTHNAVRNHGAVYNDDVVRNYDVV